jgi:hypothetical protein
MVMAMGYGGGGSKSKMTYSKSSKRKQPGTYHTNKPAGGNFDEGMQSGWGGDKGVRREAAGLKNDDGAGGGKFKDTYNDASGEGHGGGLRSLKAGDGYSGTKMSKKNSSY